MAAAIANPRTVNRTRGRRMVTSQAPSQAIATRTISCRTVNRTRGSLMAGASLCARLASVFSRSPVALFCRAEATPM